MLTDNINYIGICFQYLRHYKVGKMLIFYFTDVDRNIFFNDLPHFIKITIFMYHLVHFMSLGRTIISCIFAGTKPAFTL